MTAVWKGGLQGNDYRDGRGLTGEGLEGKGRVFTGERLERWKGGYMGGGLQSSDWRNGRVGHRGKIRGLEGAYKGTMSGWKGAYRGAMSGWKGAYRGAMSGWKGSYRGAIRGMEGG